jgi:hypothetical protein
VNRRTFLRRAAIAASAAAVIPSSLVDPRSVPNPSYVTPAEGAVVGWKINPEWVNAPYEFVYFFADGRRLEDPYPARWKFPEDCGDRTKMVPICAPVYSV